MGRNDEIVVFDDQVVNRGDRQVQLQRLPMRAVIKRNEDARLSPRVEQSPSLRIFADSVHVRAIGNSVHNCAPRFPQIGRFENIRLKVVKLMSIHRDVSSVAVVRRGINQIDSTPLRHFRRDV